MMHRDDRARSLSTNIFSGVFVRGWQAFLQLFLTPIYITLLGPESYGLVILNTTLLLSVAFLDQLVSPVLVRELGSNARSDPERCRNVLRSLELISIACALLIAAVIILMAPFLSNHWISSQALNNSEICTALVLMGISIACQWPSLLYSAGFVGLHRQDALAIVRIAISTCQSVFGVLLLWLVAPRIDLLLIWHAAWFLGQSLLLRYVLWRLMPEAVSMARFDGVMLRSIWRFATGTMIIGITASLLTQGDKLIISKIATLEQFSAYGISFFLVSSVSSLLVAPVLSALQPRFAGLIQAKDDARLVREYHRWTQFGSLIALTTLGVLVFYPEFLLQFWLGASSSLVAPISELLPWVAAGSIINAMCSMPFLLQISAGWVRLSIIKNLISLIFFLPAIYFGTQVYGVVAGAVCWLMLNLGYFFIEVPFVHQRLLRGQQWKWWANDTLLPLVLAGALFYLFSRWLPGENRWFALGYIAATTALVGIALTIVLPDARTEAMARGRKAAAALGLFKLE